MKKVKRKNKGFTLLEILIYLGLFAMLLGGAVIASYSIFESSGRNQTKSILEEEGDFILAKIRWALSGAQTVNSPVTNATSTFLSVVKWDTSIGNPVIVNPVGTNATLSRGANPAQTLNNSNVSVSNMIFTHTYKGAAEPESVDSHFTLTAQTPGGATVSGDFDSTNYLRK